MLYAHEDVGHVRGHGNCKENKFKRKKFALKLLECQSQHIRIVFTEEKNFNYYYHGTWTIVIG